MMVPRAVFGETNPKMSDDFEDEGDEEDDDFLDDDED